MKKSIFLTSFLGLLTCSILILSSCTQSGQYESSNSETIINKDVVANAKLAVDIEGMVCSKGCVKAIESKFAKVAGVGSCEVDYDAGMGMATIAYDKEQISEDELIAVFPTIGSGQYKAVKSEVQSES